MIAWKIIIVIMYEKPNRTLQVLNPLKPITETEYLTEELSLDI